MNNPALKSEFLATVRENEIGEKLIEYIPDMYFFVKDSQSQFVMANRSFWEKAGCGSEDELIGHTDFDFWHAQAAEAYRRDDLEVMRTGIPQINKQEIIASADGLVDWYHTTKIPVHAKDGSIVGIAGFIRDLRRANSALQHYRTMEPVIQHILRNYPNPIRTEELAKIAAMSLPRFTRRFKREFQVTPSRYLTMVRLNAACRLLAGTLKPVSDIALEAGFYDHSFFTKQFVKYKGIAPKEFRRRFRDIPEQARFFPLGVIDEPMAREKP